MEVSCFLKVEVGLENRNGSNSLLKKPKGRKLLLKNRDGSISLLREEITETEVRCLSKTRRKQAVVKKNRNGSKLLLECGSGIGIGWIFVDTLMEMM